MSLPKGDYGAMERDKRLAIRLLAAVTELRKIQTVEPTILHTMIQYIEAFRADAEERGMRRERSRVNRDAKKSHGPH